MAKITGKEQLFSIDLKYFKSIQGIEGKTLFDRYKSVEKSLLSHAIDIKYQDFLAYPVQEGDIITFYSSLPDQIRSSWLCD